MSKPAFTVKTRDGDIHHFSGAVRVQWSGDGNWLEFCKNNRVHGWFPSSYIAWAKSTDVPNTTTLIGE